MQVFRIKHITAHGEEICKCIFQIKWLGGSNVGQRDIVHCENIYLLGFGSIEKHPVLKEATQFLKGRKYSKSL